MAPLKPRPRRTSATWHKRSKTAQANILRSLKRKLEEGPDVPFSSKDILGRYRPVHPDQTTLSRCLGPFQGTKFVEFVYWQSPQLQTTTAGGTFLDVKPNSCFDYDSTGNLGNKQPLYYDTLLSALGPYKSYKVISWTTTWTFINASTLGVNIFVSPPVTASSECDSVAEAEDMPGVRKLTLTAEGGSFSRGTITTKGHIRDVYPGLPFSTTFVAGSTSDPTSIVHQTVVYQPADGAAVTKLYVGVKHTMMTELGQVDALVS